MALKKTVVLSILDYQSGKTTIITDFPPCMNAEEFVSNYYGLDNVEWMTTFEQNIEISTLDNINLDR